ncbi:MAG: glycosyltransferase family 39 protein [Dehalococcoidia bacterium]|nr:glycosyltransferase family 39 protein [Dehalococcoidia bacterium]
MYSGPVLLLAFGLRVFRLDGQSLWYDEGNSAFMTARSLPDIIAGAAADIHPPLYYVVLSWWSGIGGYNEFGLRFLSVVFGLLLVAILYTLAKKLFARQAGLAAAAIAAVSPFLIYYSQEARMYMLGALLCALAGLFFVKAIEKDRYWAGYALAAAAALYTQYYAFGVILALNIFFVAAILWRSGRGLWSRWLAANIAAVLLYLPWLPSLANQASLWPRASQTQMAGNELMLWVTRGVLVTQLGPLDPKDAASASAMFNWLAPSTGLLIIAAVGWPVLNRAFRGKPLGVLGRWMGLLFVVTVAAVSWCSLLAPIWRPPFQAKFLVFGLPWLYLWMGLGIVCLSGAARRFLQHLANGFQPKGRGRYRIPWPIPLIMPTSLPLLSIGLVVFTALQWYYFDPRYSRDDYRGLTRYIETQAQPSDSIILDAPGQAEIFAYYYRGQTPVYPLPMQRPLVEIATGNDLATIASASGRVWAVLWGQRESDPNNFIERWLDQSGFETADRWYGGVRLVLYTMSGQQERSVSVNDRLGDYARLSSVTLHAAPTSGDGRLVRVASGDVIPLTIRWEPIAPTPQRYKVFVHLLGPNATLWGQHDAEPAGGAQPTTGWTPGQLVSDNHGLPVPPGAPPGTYQIEVGLYNMETGQRLPVFDNAGNLVGDRVVLQPVEVTRPAVFPSREGLAIEQPLEARFDGVTLMGYEMFKLGTEIGNRDFHTGDMAQLSLFWRVSGPASPAYHPIQVRLLDSAGTALADDLIVPGYNYPMDRWDPGEIVRAQYKVALRQPPGVYRLVVSLGEAGVSQPPQPAGSGLKLMGGGLVLTEIQIR